MKQIVVYKGKEYPIKYQHIRAKDDKGNILQNGGMTTAFIKEYKAEETLLTAAAFCSLKDNYCKLLGRRISSGRLIKKIQEEERKLTE